MAIAPSALPRKLPAAPASVRPPPSVAPLPGPMPSQVVRAQPAPGVPLPGTIPLASRLSSSELPGTAPLAPGALPISHGPTTGAHAQRLRQRAPTVRAEDAATRPLRTTSSTAVLWGSVALALVILCVGVFIAWRREAAQQRERQRIYQERIEQVRRQNG